MTADRTVGGSAAANAAGGIDTCSVDASSACAGEQAEILASRLRTQGYAVIERLVPPAQVAAYTETLEGHWRRVGCPPLFSQEDQNIEEGMHISPVGLALAGILSHVPSLGEVLLEPRLLATLRSLLGPAFALEMGSGILSDAARGFFFWHQHAGGIDEPDLRRRHYPTYARVERLVCTLYGAPLDEEHGSLLVYPKAVTESTAPPHSPGREPWPGAHRVHAPPGSMLLIDQGTWHAVTPMRATGRRAFFGFFVRRGDLPASKRTDPSIAAALAASPALAKAYGGLA